MLEIAHGSHEWRNTVAWCGITAGRGYVIKGEKARMNHNSLVPISQLPDYLLTEIFVLVRDLETPSYFPSPACFRVSYVCRTWRNAAIECSLLWTNIILHPPELTAIMLHRARTAPLTVEVFISYTVVANHAFLNSLRLALSHIRHIRYLSVTHSTSYSHIDDQLSPLKSGEPDTLEELRLEGSSDQPSPFYPPFKIRSNLCKTAPNLHTLELSRCRINWKLFCSVGNLTSLSLLDIPASSRPSMDNILFVLQSMNKLERLNLIHALPKLPTNVRTLPEPRPIVPVRLENLSRLVLQGCVLDCADLMRYVIMPHCTVVYLEAESRWPFRDIALAVSPLSNIISSILSRSDEKKIHFIGSLQHTCPNRIDIRLHPASLSCPPVGAGYTFQASLIWPSYRRLIVGSDASCGFGKLLLALPLRQITQFTATLFSMSEEIGSAEWLRVIRRLSRLKTVVLRGGYTYNFVSALQEAYASLSSPGNWLDNTILPDLAELTIEHAHFSFPPGENQLFSTLTRSLTQRQQLKFPIPKIILRECHITPQQLAILDSLTSELVESTGVPETWGVGELDLASINGDDLRGDGDNLIQGDHAED